MLILLDRETRDFSVWWFDLKFSGGSDDLKLAAFRPFFSFACSKLRRTCRPKLKLNTYRTKKIRLSSRRSCVPALKSLLVSTQQVSLLKWLSCHLKRRPTWCPRCCTLILWRCFYAVVTPALVYILAESTSEKVYWSLGKCYTNLAAAWSGIFTFVKLSIW